MLPLVVAITVSSCTNTSKTASYSYKPVGQYEVSAESKVETVSNSELNARKIIYQANLKLTAEVPETVNENIEAIAKNHEGYVQELGTYNATIRVKSDKLNQALDEIETLGKVSDKNISGTDQTEQYLDLQIRLENAEKARDRYLELLKQAENVEAALLVEKELERLNGMIDLYKGKLNRIGHLAEFSTIHIKLQEKVKPGLLGYVGIGAYSAVKWLFVRSYEI